MALSVAASPNERHFVVGCADHDVYHWDLGMRKCQSKYQGGHSDMVWGVHYLERRDAGTVKIGDDYDFVSVGDDGAIQLYS